MRHRHQMPFGAEGTFAGVKERLGPLSDFPGRPNWGYDGVLPYAPDSAYGTPEELKDLVRSAHERGLMVFLDVVYNHFGPEGDLLYASGGAAERELPGWSVAWYLREAG